MDAYYSPASAATPRPSLHSSVCVNGPVLHSFLEFCKENGGYTGCPFPAKLDLQQGQNLLQDMSKLSSSTSGMAGPRWARWGTVLGEEVRKSELPSFLSRTPK